MVDLPLCVMPWDDLDGQAEMVCVVNWMQNTCESDVCSQGSGIPKKECSKECTGEPG